MPPFGGLWGNVRDSFMARWKVLDRLPISANQFFCQLSQLRRYERILVEIVVFERELVTLSTNFRGRGHPPTNFGVRKLETLGYHVVLFA